MYEGVFVEDLSSGFSFKLLAAMSTKKFPLPKWKTVNSFMDFQTVSATLLFRLIKGTKLQK